MGVGWMKRQAGRPSGRFEGCKMNRVCVCLSVFKAGL